MNNPQSIYIGIDLGTSGVRACAINDSEELVKICSTSLPAPHQQHSSITQDAQLWWLATQKVLNELFTHINAADVSAISVNGTSGSVLVCDAQGVPLAPARMYNDGFCTEQAALLESIVPRNSAAHGTSCGLAKLLYLQRQFPQAHHLCHQADWIVGQLSGRFDITDANNALKTGYDPVAEKWPDWMEDLHIQQQLLPKVVAAGTAIAYIKEPLCKEYQLKANCQVISGTTDSIAAFIATGAHKPGDAVTSLGSTLVLKIISDKPLSAPEFGIYSHKLGDYWLAGGASNSGGAVLRHYFTQLQIDKLTDTLIAEQDSGSLADSGLDYYPLLQKGERFPLNDPELKPRLEPRPDTDIQFFQGILEAISRIECEGYNKLHMLGAPFPSQVTTAGGGSQNTAWSRIRQQTLGVPLEQAVFSEACYGSALLAKRGFNPQFAPPE